MRDSRAFDEGKKVGTEMFEARFSGEKPVTPKSPYKHGTTEDQDWRAGLMSVDKAWSKGQKAAWQKNDDITQP